MESNWILLKSYDNESEALIKLQFLESMGIRAIILNKRDSSYPVFGVTELYCHLSQAHQALDIIENEDQ